MIDLSNTDIGFLGVAAAGLLVLVAVAISLWQRLGLERDLLIAAVRALVQLLLVGLLLDVLIGEGQPLYLSWMWVVVMIAIAGFTVSRRVPELRVTGWFATAAFVMSTAVSLGVLFGLGVFEMEGRTIVPLAGLTIGNSLAATVLVSRRVLAELDEKRLEVEARLALGQPARVAAQPYLRTAIRTALIPQIEVTKAVGLIVLPGAMTGLLLAGVQPIDAVRIQAAVMYLVLASVAISVSFVALMVGRTLFTPAHQLVGEFGA
jgi:putative ABC transport system permease protein